MICRFADVNFDIILRDPSVWSRLKPYAAEGVADHIVKVEDEEYAEMFETYGQKHPCLTEFLVLSQKISDILLKEHNGFLFHSSAISYKGSGILFSAPSGTGKSTHSAFWKKAFGDDVIYVNDDKPFIREINGEFFVYGNPWDGKERKSNNIKVPIKAICFIERGSETEVKPISVPNAVVSFYNQSFRPEEEDMQDKFLKIIEELLSKVRIIKLYLPLDENSPKAVLEAIKGDL